MAASKQALDDLALSEREYEAIVERLVAKGDELLGE